MKNPLASEIIAAFDGMSSQLQIAARFVLDRPRDVALLSMRELARQAKVQPATMTRLAKHLGFDGYEALRQIFMDAARDGRMDFAERADRQVANQQLNGDQSLAAQMAANLEVQIADLGSASALDSFTIAAASLSGARRVYCLGMRSSFPAAWHFRYVLSLVRDGVLLLDGNGSTTIDMLRHMSADDALLVISVHPYTREAVDIVDHVASKGLKIVAITDSQIAPVAERAHQIVLIKTESPSFFHTMTPAFAAAEILATLVTGRGGANALEALERTEEQLDAFDTHFDSKKRRR